MKVTHPRKNVAIMGVKSRAAWDNITTVSQALSELGNNSGNLMFTHALQKAVAFSTAVGFGALSDELSQYDAVVIAAANWVNEFEDFGWLYARLKDVKVPIFLVGLGAQAPVGGGCPVVAAGTRRLLDLVSERSHSISCRGTYSAEVLASLGVRNVNVTGCPSLLIAGPQGPRLRDTQVLSPSDIVLHGTRHFFNRADPFQESVYRVAIAGQHDLILQSELADIYLALQRKSNPDILANVRDVLPAIYDETYDVIDNYLSRHGRFFTNFEDWIKYMRTRAFCLGTRIHGTIAALLAGTPAVLLMHDSRTREMAESMSIPAIDTKGLERLDSRLVNSAIEQFDRTTFLASYQAYHERFESFFASNGLSLRS